MNNDQDPSQDSNSNGNTVGRQTQPVVNDQQSLQPSQSINQSIQPATQDYVAVQPLQTAPVNPLEVPNTSLSPYRSGSKAKQIKIIIVLVLALVLGSLAVLGTSALLANQANMQIITAANSFVKSATEGDYEEALNKSDADENQRDAAISLISSLDSQLGNSEYSIDDIETKDDKRNVKYEVDGKDSKRFSLVLEKKDGKWKVTEINLSLASTSTDTVTDQSQNLATGDSGHVSVYGSGYSFKAPNSNKILQPVDDSIKEQYQIHTRDPLIAINVTVESNSGSVLLANFAVNTKIAMNYKTKSDFREVSFGDTSVIGSKEAYESEVEWDKTTTLLLAAVLKDGSTTVLIEAVYPTVRGSESRQSAKSILGSLVVN